MTAGVTLADLCSDIVDCAHKTAPIDESGQYFAVGTPAMRNHIINLSEARRISEATFKAWTTRLRPRAGDLLLAREAPVGPVVRVPESENVAPGQRTVLLRPREGVCDPRFLYYFLTSPRVQAELQVKAAGSTVPHLNVADVRTLPAQAVPSLAEQQAIAELLGALDDKIAANGREVTSAEALMVALAGRTGELAKVADLAAQSTRSVRTSDFPERVAHFSLPAFDGGKLPEDAAGDSIKSNKFLIDEPCVLVSKLNPRFPRIWNVAAVPERMPLASTEFVVLVPRTISSALLWAALSAPQVSTQLAGLVAGTSGSHQRVRPAEMLDVWAPDPRSLAETTRDTVTALGALTQRRRLESQQLATARDELLPLLMSGKVRVKDAEKTVEGVL